MHSWISREEEARLPNFTSVKEAEAYFLETYGSDRFMLSGTEDIEGELIYFYHYIVDLETYTRMQNYLRQSFNEQVNLGVQDTSGFIECYQPVEIWEDGRVHIIH